MVEQFIIRSKIRKLSQGLWLSSDLYAALDNAIVEIMGKAAARARANRRKTIQGRDI